MLFLDYLVCLNQKKILIEDWRKFWEEDSRPKKEVVSTHTTMDWPFSQLDEVQQVVQLFVLSNSVVKSDLKVSLFSVALIYVNIQFRQLT